MTGTGQERPRPSPVSNKALLSLLLETFYFRKEKKEEEKLAIVFHLIGHTLIKETADTDLKFNQSQP